MSDLICLYICISYLFHFGILFEAGPGSKFVILSTAIAPITVPVYLGIITYKDK